MRIALIFILNISLLAFPVNGFSDSGKNAVPQDCAICGHACCCPEVCAPKLKEMKQKSHGRDGCDQAVSTCQLESKPPLAMALTKENLVEISPRSWDYICNLHTIDGFSSRVDEFPFVNTSAPFLDVFTPPPEILI